MTVRVRYFYNHSEYESSVEQLLVHSGSASTRMMKYLIALTEVLLSKKLIDKHDLNHLAHAYQADVHVIAIVLDATNIDNAYDVEVSET